MTRVKKNAATVEVSYSIVSSCFSGCGQKQTSKKHSQKADVYDITEVPEDKFFFFSSPTLLIVNHPIWSSKDLPHLDNTPKYVGY